MKLVTVNPYRRVTAPVNSLVELMEDLWARPMWDQPNESYLALDVQEVEGGYAVTGDLPGWNADALKIEVLDNTLTIRGEKVQNSEEKQKGYLLKERRTANFSRTIRLPKPLDANKVSAELKDGVLNLHLPVAEEAKPKAINVKIA